jgi:superoxide dismutase, Fe-Mn family
MSDNRREFLKKAGLLGLAGIAGNTLGNSIKSADSITAFMGDNTDLPPLPYGYDALEPFIDKQTMEIHHGKHHKGYIDKLKTAPAADFDPKLSLEESCMKVDEKTSALIRNNLGGHYNHTFFWQIMRSAKDKKGGAEGKFGNAISQSFGSLDKLKSEFSDKASKHFGSGWCWLIVDAQKKLKITTTPNQDNPLMKLAPEKGTPVLALDVWEHAYYLKYQNKRADYITSWWNVVDWQRAGELYDTAMK